MDPNLIDPMQAVNDRISRLHEDADGYRRARLAGARPRPPWRLRGQRRH